MNDIAQIREEGPLKELETPVSGQTVAVING
jgi:hypothetical protein